MSCEFYICIQTIRSGFDEIAEIQFVPERIITGILPYALRTSTAVQIRSRRISQQKSGCFGKLLIRCSTIGTPHRYIPVGDLDRSPLMRSYGYASADDQSTLFAMFPLIFVPFMQYAG